MNNFNVEQEARTSVIGTFFVYLSFIFIIPIFVYIAKTNWFRKTEIKINESVSGIDVQLTRRKDTLTKLIDAVKGTMKFEKETQKQITELRKVATNTGNTNQQLKSNSMMDGLSRSLNVQLEAYPDLKSTNSIIELQKAIKEIENNIAAARRIYNANISNYNISVKTWPSNVVAKNLHLSTKLFFEAKSDERKDIKVEF